MKKPYKGEIDGYVIKQINVPNLEELHGPNLGYIVIGNFRNHPRFRGFDAIGARTSLVVKYTKSTGRLETLNSVYKLLDPYKAPDVD